METAIVVGVFSLLTIAANFIFARLNKQQDWARMDQVASAAAASAMAATVAARSAENAASAQLAATREAATAAQQVVSIGEATLAQGAQIHQLVNSNFTEAKRLQLDLLHQNIVLLEAAPPSEARTAALAIARRRIEELERELSDRAAAQLVVDQQVANETARRAEKP